jgi:hypothetical protein
MALTQCLDCGKDVSTLATACPNCGRPLDSHQLELANDEDRNSCPDENHTRGAGEGGNSNNYEEETRESGTTPTKDGTQNIIAVLITCIMLIALGFLIHHEKNEPTSSPKFEAAPSPKNIGQMVTVPGDTLGCIDESIWDKLIDISVREGREGFTERASVAIAGGLCAKILAGTQGKLVDSAMSLNKIKLDNGQYYWVMSSATQ